MPDPRLFSSVLDALEDAVFVIDASGSVVWQNAGASRISATQVDGVEALAREVMTKRATTATTIIQNGTYLVARAALLDELGLAVVVVRDVTAEQERELRLVETEKLASLGLLSAGVGHEINNPTAFVLANLRVLRELLGGFGASASKSRVPRRDAVAEANAIVDECELGMQRIEAISRDLRAFVQSPKDPDSQTSVNAAIESALNMLKNELRHRARVEVDLKATLYARSCASRLSQVFLNLLLNAAQALDETRIATNLVTVRSRDEGEQVLVEICDNGPGIAPDVLPRIFEYFFTTKPRGVGTGMGLPLSSNIVRSAGGDIEVRSAPGEATTFRVRLPGVSPPKKRLSMPSPAPTTRKRGRILVVDDEVLLLKAYRRMLTPLCDVVTAQGGQEAIDLLSGDQDFDVVLCDLLMPGVSGIDLFQTVERRWPALRERFIFATGGAFTEQSERFLVEASPPTWIEKPIDLERLFAMLEKRLPKASDPGTSGG